MDLKFGSTTEDSATATHNRALGGIPITCDAIRFKTVEVLIKNAATIPPKSTSTVDV